MDASPVEIGQTLLTLGAASALYFKIQSAVRQMAGKGDAREITNNPLITQDSPRPATLEDVQREAHRITALERRLDAHISESRAANHDLQDSMTKLRDKIDVCMRDMNDELRELIRAVGRLEGP